MEGILFHGILDIWVYEATKVENQDRYLRSARDMFGKRLPESVIKKNEGLLYVTVSLAGVTVARTSTIGYTERNPVWNQRLIVPVAHYSEDVRFGVKNSAGLEFHGTGWVVFSERDKIIQGNKVEGTFRIRNGLIRRESRTPAELKLSIQYIPVERLESYNHGVGSAPDYIGIPHTYFPLRRGGKITLYQDAHVSDGCLPPVKLHHGVDYEHGKCWYDIFNSIRQARHLIYITGWSLYHKVRLVRDVTNASESDSTLGDLLKSKSKEGVKVLLLIWDDPTSVTTWAYRTDGLMQTHDEETRRFFKHTSVKVLLTPRSAGKQGAKQQEAGTIYTHHQKSVMVDADAGNNKRKIVAFIGGLDLCDGRYDTPQHPLFRTLQTLHKDDYYNPSFKGPTVGCPREAWHDSHCKIDGPAAYDVFTNFEDRWYKASKGIGDDLLRIDLTPDIIWSLDTSGLDENDRLGENDPEAWHVQVFCSIDSNSVECFPEDPIQVTNTSLVFGNDNVVIDMSIHSAYVHAIRAAHHFIYIENQHFHGSSYNWAGYKEDLGENNLIPMEIALKIANKIRANERFAAYILVPMWPEGVPTSTVTQRMLFWQCRTMEMMYGIIYKALEEVGLQQAFVPQDYLNFFCLGNREAPDGTGSSFGGRPTEPNTPQELARKSRRFMIYVHSNGMIVDDEYIILGSANINQRSMEGTKDTEIAMGAYQPEHTWARKLSSPRGQIYGYRMSLWAEHIGMADDCFTQPESLECVRRVRSLGESNWKQFAADDATEMRGHLLKYPVQVDQTGKLKSLPGTESFPDVGGNILGNWDPKF